MRPKKGGLPETREPSGRIMRQMSAKSRRAVAVVAVLFLLVAGGLAAVYLTNRREVTTSSAAAYAAYREGVENNQRFYRKEAQVAFARALALDPNFAMAMLRLAGLSNSDQRTSLVERARRLRGRLTDRERLFVDMAYAEVQGKTEERNKLARAIFDKYPDDVDAAMILCNIEMSQGRAERALEIYSGLLARDPNNAAVYNSIGYYHAWRGDYDRAIENLRKYQFMAPDQANPYDSLGEVQAYSGHYDEAIANLNRALALKTDFFDSIFHLGVAYRRPANGSAPRRVARGLLRRRPGSDPGGRPAHGGAAEGEEQRNSPRHHRGGSRPHRGSESGGGAPADGVETQASRRL